MLLVYSRWEIQVCRSFLLNNFIHIEMYYCGSEMYTGRVACCPLVSHGEYADWTGGQMDGRQTVTLRFALDAWVKRSWRVVKRIFSRVHNDSKTTRRCMLRRFRVFGAAI